MLKYFKKSEFYYLSLFILLISILSFASFWRVLTFHFWRDDWAFLWTGQHQPMLLLTSTLHPATWIEDLLLFKLFGWNPFWWNILGISLRIIASISVYFMTLSFLRSKTVAILAGLFLASSPIGLEAIGWTNAHNTTLMIIIDCMTLYFWFLNNNKPNYKYLLLSYLLLYIAILLDPGKALPLVILILMAELFRLRTEKVGNNLRTFISLIVLIIIAQISYLTLPAHIINKTGLMINNVQPLSPVIQNFFSSIGNLLYGSFFPMKEFAGLTPYSPKMEKLAIIFIALAGGTTFFLGMIRRSKSILSLTFFVVWIIVFYIPAWVFEKSFIASATHRYLALSGVGLLEIVALAISFAKNKTLVTCLALLLIVVNIYNSNRILKNESFHRSIKIVNRVWDQAVKDVPNASSLNLFLFQGDYSLKQSIVDWAGETLPWPYIVKMGINESTHFPRILASKQLVLKSICQNQSSLSNLYVWNITKDTIDNVSFSEREAIKREALQNGCKIKND